ncbi:MAG TPA: anhydro-N-acetylmuramic acid kinase [Phycisphaerae bacterium]|nr:anhydro-N-acetylmuramic acid kinase [Phycisphaerae bacterium]HRR84654.1 anhydro-N-acetylmuramic acid kinase [Phycisphaerae bacterium]
MNKPGARISKRSSRLRRPADRSAVGLVLGLMAGTSGDGIDLACVRIEGVGARMRPRLLWHRHTGFPPSLRRRLLAVMAPGETTTQEIAHLHADLGEAFGKAAAWAIGLARGSERPSLIGLSGQTVCHLPGPTGRTVTLQLGEPARVAARTGLPVVAEFRQSDVAAGGQGAPLVPWTDWALFRHHRISRAIQNIGGIANVTWLPAGGDASRVIAFDTGPGNMVIDAVVRCITGGRETMDRGGRRAAKGRVLGDVLDQWLRHPYFEIKPPKTTGREDFGKPFMTREIKHLAAAGSRPDDWVATATALTARSIAQAYRRFLPDVATLSARRRKIRGGSALPAMEVIVCGGGARNPTLMLMLQAELRGATVRRIEEFGISAQAKEAVSFAMLAKAYIDGVPGNLPQVTGARRPALLGRLVWP